ncbi:hypothetical protein Sjap_014738 [Stephania japonica]|uniref:Pectinesterase inhibitor domain-containing protein n=1 Tax=Stephania japonica TaxID=461633 RepID=A0AAP0IHV4_9MAGN
MAFTLSTPSALILSITIMTLITTIPSISAVNLPPNPSNGPDFIRTSCNATLYPDICYKSLSRYALAVQRDPAQLARVAVAVSLTKARRMAQYVSAMSHRTIGAEPKALSALRDCFSTFGDAVDEIRSSLAELRRMPSAGSASGSGPSAADDFRFQMSNVQTWMSAALTNEDTCTDGFDVVADSPVKAGVCDQATKVRKVTSNALALVNSFAAKVEGEEDFD